MIKSSQMTITFDSMKLFNYPLHENENDYAKTLTEFSSFLEKSSKISDSELEIIVQSN